MGPALDTSNSIFEALIVNVLAPFARMRGDAAVAERYVREILPQGPATEPGGALFFVAQQMQRLAAALALDTGDLEMARRWLDAHDRWLDWSGAALNRAEAALLWARYNWQTGDPTGAYLPAARARCAEARAIWVSLGARPTLARVDALLAALDGPASAVPAYPAGLSAREVEVLRHLAAGQTNSAIAAALSLSEHTVRAHLRHIFAKIDADNRAAAAAYALRHGLA